MADFCNICSGDLFGESVEPEIDVYEMIADLESGYAFQVLCEGCGMSHVGKEENGTPYLLFMYNDDEHEERPYSLKEWETGDLRTGL
jgi:hypothetical protein